MTVQVYREKESGSLRSNRVPYFIYEDDATKTLDRITAVFAGENQAFADAGVGVNDYVDEQLSNRVWRFEAIYSETRLSKLSLPDTGDVEIGFRYQAEPQLVKYSLETIDHGGYSNTTFAPKLGNLVGVQGGQWGANLKHVGISIAPRVTNWVRYTVPNAYLSEAYETQIGNVMGHVNSVTYRGKPAGTLRFVSCSSEIRTDNDSQILFGFDYRPIIVSQTIPAIDETGKAVEMTVPQYDGHDLFWTYDELYVSQYTGPLPVPPRVEVLSKQPMFWYIERVHPRSNFFVELGI